MINLNIGSPHYSTCSKVDLLSRISPTFRNKRVPSAQDNYTQSNTNLHKNSLKKQSSPSKLSQKSKRSRSRKANSVLNTNKTTDGSITAQINYLKQQYHSLKQAYHQLIQQRLKSAKSLSQAKIQNQDLKNENEKLKKDLDKYKSKISFLQLQIQRIKKQCIKLLEVQQFKSKKLQQNLRQKQQTIRALMKISDQQLGQKPQVFQRIKSLVSCDSNSIVVAQQSLMISQDKPFSSVHNRNQSQFISISLTSMMQDENAKQSDISTKRKPFQNKENKNYNNFKKNIANQKKISQRIIYTQGQNIQQQHDNMRKMRKQLHKKLQINIDQRGKDHHFGNPLKTPVSHGTNERKNSKLKNSKSKSKKVQEDIVDNGKFMKKKLK